MNNQYKLKTAVPFFCVVIFSLLLASCVMPKSEIDESYAHCNLVTKSWSLDNETSALSGAALQCATPECILVFLSTGGAITAVSAIVSGSIVLVGNAIHWVEKQGSCDESTLSASTGYVRDTVTSIQGTIIETKDQLLDIIVPDSMQSKETPSKN